jgi:hypothetical protein
LLQSSYDPQKSAMKQRKWNGERERKKRKSIGGFKGGRVKELDESCVFVDDWFDITKMFIFVALLNNQTPLV